MTFTKRNKLPAKRSADSSRFLHASGGIGARNRTFSFRLNVVGKQIVQKERSTDYRSNHEHRTAALALLSQTQKAKTE